MLFTSVIFVFIFLPVLLFFYYVLSGKSIKLKNLFACIASVIFYAYGEKKFIYVLLVSVVINYISAILIDKLRSKEKKTMLICAFIASLCFNLGILFLWKYLNFTIFNINLITESLLGKTFIRQTHAILPIGLSFYTFQAISYNIDVLRGEKAQKNIINTALYLLFFPQLIAGPIVRYETICKQIEDRHTTIDDFVCGIKRFIIGIGKKVIIANNVSLLAEYAFQNNVSVLMAWIGAISFSLQIYFDFSGYSDMAIGLGRMFGFHYEENFNYPYIAKSITDFWRRWHISLSSWFRDYVYIPLGGSRVKAARHIFNLFVVWLLTGIWHGANWTFVLWGLTYFVFLTIEKYLVHPERFNNKLIKAIYMVITLLIVNFEWVIFNSESIQTAFNYILCMFGANGSIRTISDLERFYINEYWVYFALGVIFASPAVSMLIKKCRKNDVADNAINIINPVVYMFILFFAISFLIIGAHNPFVYFNF